MRASAGGKISITALVLLTLGSSAAPAAPSTAPSTRSSTGRPVTVQTADDKTITGTLAVLDNDQVTIQPPATQPSAKSTTLALQDVVEIVLKSPSGSTT